jgi:hypothetical protein
MAKKSLYQNITREAMSFFLDFMDRGKRVGRNSDET